MLVFFFFTEPARYSGEVKAAPYIDCNHNNDVCQASTLSAEEITKIKQVFLFNSKTKLSAFAKKKRLLLSIAIKKITFNDLHFVSYLYLFELLLLNQNNPKAV